MSETVKGRSDYILGVIQITVWIFWIQEMHFLKKDSSKTYGGILMKFSGYVLNGTKNKLLDFGNDLDHCLDP